MIKGLICLTISGVVCVVRGRGDRLHIVLVDRRGICFPTLFIVLCPCRLG